MPAGHDSDDTDHTADSEAEAGVVGNHHDVVVARRVVVVDEHGRPRLVAETAGDTIELRLEVPGGAAGRRSAVVLHASGTPGTGGPDAPLLGLQLWADGEVLAELDAWPGADGRWRPHLHLGEE